MDFWEKIYNVIDKTEKKLYKPQLSNSQLHTANVRPSSFHFAE